MPVLLLLLLAFALLGHAAFWVGVVNRWHAFGFARPLIKTVTLAFYAALLGLPPLMAYHLAVFHPHESLADWGAWKPWSESLNGSTAYLAFSAAYGAFHLPRWAWERWRQARLPEGVSLHHNRVVDVARQLGGAPVGSFRTRLFCRIPFNQLWHLHVSEFNVQVPRLAESLADLSICHWSDLHISGRIDRGYFREMVRLTNEMQADLIALTGDVCDVARHIDWIPEILGPAQARLGKFFILGNHDLRTHEVARLRAALVEAGFADVGQRQALVQDGRVLIAGNEGPWFAAPRSKFDAQAASDPRPLKILLAHTPDQFGWAQREQFDVMLAGHTHGGQICFPGIGPVVCPSWHGTKYAAGFFRRSPTLLHVSRGSASLAPLRILCPPEITKLVLKAKKHSN